ncbi:transcriptional regulator prz1-like [Limulus polyphemus]|uniref:Transcriptional regulator prz1-like n=1 Tax=Limulus polyphemus TaxID=6850 RepID=A0ABM1SUA1_LIMPO|nr:transcriptional regulator prz1-like [Limulus polyphemus]XP_022247205.1 transcriptional regulator prz1-like [Limulus polyphemus]XP_022247206.1 transcriptional regulator prz1-like [Limulus polyphemus]XP_022247207.1 transcriptional regulator prz1-like [Limulus polyphemus]
MMTENAHSSVMTTASSGSDGSSEISASSALYTSCDDGSKLNQHVSQSTSSAQESIILDTQANFNQVPAAKNEQKESKFGNNRDAHSPLTTVERRTVLSSHVCNTSVPYKFQDSPISACGVKKPCKSPNSPLLLQKDIEPSDLSHISHNTKLKEHLVEHSGLRKEGPLSLIVPSDSTGSEDEHDRDLFRAGAMQLQDSHIISPSSRAPQRNSVHLAADEPLTLNSYQPSCSHEIHEVLGEPVYSNGTKLQRLPPVSTIMQSRLASLVKEGFKMPFDSSHFVPFADLSYSHDPHHSEVVCLSTVNRPEANTLVYPISLASNKTESEGTFLGDSVDSLQCTSLCEAGPTSHATPRVAPVITSIPDFSKIHSGNMTNTKDIGGSIPTSVNKFPQMDHRGPLLFGEDGHPIVVPSTNPLLTPLDLGNTTLRMVTSHISSQPPVKNTCQMNMSTFSNRLVSSRPILGVPTGVITTVGSSNSSSAKAPDLPSNIQEHPSLLIAHAEDVNLLSTASKNDSVLEEQDFSEVIDRSNSEGDETDEVCKPSSINTNFPTPTSELPSVLSSLGSQSYMLSNLVSSGSSGSLTLTKTVSSNIPITTGVSLIRGMQSGLTSPYVPPFLLSGILPTSLCGTSVKHEPHEATTSQSVTSAGGLLYSGLSTLPSLISVFKQESPTDNTSGSGPLPPFTVVSGMPSLSKQDLAEFVAAQSNFSNSGSHLEEVSVKEEPFDDADTSPSESLSASHSPMLQNTCNLPGLSRLSTIPHSTNPQGEISPTLTHATTVPSQQMTAGFSHTATAPSRISSTTCIDVASSCGSSSGRKLDLLDKKNCQLCRINKPCSLHPSQSCSMSSNMASDPLLSSDPAKPFQCNLCGKRLASKNVYQLHMRSHTGEKPFTCNLCGHNFSQKTSLTRHIRSHTGERPFPCEVCGKRFADKERTKIHMRTHTGEKPFSCKMCGKCFSQKSTVKRHMSVHTGEKPFTCETCGKGFANRGNLNAHSKTHTSNVST